MVSRYQGTKVLWYSCIRVFVYRVLEYSGLRALMY